MKGKSRVDKVLEMSKKGNTARIKRSEILYYRMLTVVVALFAVITGIQYASKSANPNSILPLILAGCFAVLSVASVIVALILKKKNKKEFAVLDCPFLAGLFGCLALTFAMMWFNTASPRRLILYVSIWALTYLVWCLFDRETFSFSVYTIIGGVALSLLRKALLTEKMIVIVFLVIWAILAVVVTLIGKKNDVKIGKQIVFGKTFKAYPYYISAGIMLAGIITNQIIAGGVIYALALLGIYYMVYTVVNALSNM